LPDKKRENHWWDCIVECAVAASKQGVKLVGNVHQSTGCEIKQKIISLEEV
jgi:hypothetical protein